MHIPRFYIVAAGPKAGQGVAVARNLLASDGTDWLPKDEAWPCTELVVITWD